MSCSVFVGNLTWSTTNEQLQEFANSVGHVVSADVKRHEDTAKSKGWGLVTFSDHRSAERSVAELNGRELNGRAVYVRHDATHNIYVGNLSWALSNDDLYELFQGFRPVGCKIFTNATSRSRGFAIVKFTNEGDATRAVAALNMAEVNGRNIECRIDRGPGTSVFVGNVGQDATDESLAAMFAHLGTVESVKLGRNTDWGWGILRFSDPAAAKAAVDNMNGVEAAPGLGGMKVRYDRK